MLVSAVLVLAWFFEWTPAGLVADGAATLSATAAHRRNPTCRSLCCSSEYWLPRRDVDWREPNTTRAVASGTGRYLAVLPSSRASRHA